MPQSFFETAPLPLFAADFDYFRISREKWDLLVTRLKQMGSNALYLTIPWGFHEFDQGSVDLNGATNPRRDLKGLLTLCATLDLPCLLSVGPYSNRGVLNDGLPFWLSLDADAFETSLTQGVEGWYKAVSKAVADQQWPGGPVVALTINSEPPPRQVSVLSKQLTEVKWRIWLRKRYEGIEALNAEYGTEHRTINDVKFPQDWAQADMPLARDVKEFLAKVQSDTETHYTQTLVDAGWLVPIYPSAKELHPELPALQSHSLNEPDDLSTLTVPEKILNLQLPIQVDPEPVEVGQTTFWANNAPIRADGSVRQKFWTVRQLLWSPALNAKVKGPTLTASFDTASLVTSGEAAALKINVGIAKKPGAFRLRLNGELINEEQLIMKQGKLSGPYLAEDDLGQTDLILTVADPGSPLTDFPMTYLLGLLAAQAHTLQRCATLSKNLGNVLTISPSSQTSDPAESPQVTLNTLEQARRGLREADAALKKAITSISGLENGFATILDKTGSGVTPQPASAAAAITPEIFEASIQDVLVGIGRTCQELESQLKAAATKLQSIIAAPDDFTIERYRQGFNTAVTAAQAARQPLLRIITQLRQQIGSAQLPFIIWRIHDQVQEITDTLRWGVLRG